MAKQTINIGTADFAGDGESLRTAFQKVNSNFDEVYTDLVSALSSVNTFDGDYNSLVNLPDLSGYALTANVFNGDYNNLSNLPSLFDGDYNSLVNLPDLSGYALTANVFNGDYNNLSNLPSLFDGNYNSLANKPTIPTTIDSLTNVNVSSVQDGQVLVFDNTSGSWINTTPSVVEGGSSVYLVDGGGAASIYTNGDLILDGGSA
jgi:hypothetical protein